MIEIRPLAGVDLETLSTAFNDAFSDYAVRVHYTTDYLRNLLLRRGYRPDLSPGAFEGDRLVGFVFNGLENESAYNSGTGVVVSHRRSGIARTLMERSIDTLPAKKYVLEVIEGNERAEALYRSLGFSEVRRLQSWTYASDSRSETVFTELGADSLEKIGSWCDVVPSWQNTLGSIRRSPESFVILGNDDCGAVLFPSNGDLALMAVRPAARRRGLGRQLIAAVAARAARPLRIINVDDRHSGVARFLAHCGAQHMVRQIEMVRDLG